MFFKNKKIVTFLKTTKKFSKNRPLLTHVLFHIYFIKFDPRMQNGSCEARIFKLPVYKPGTEHTLLSSRASLTETVQINLH